MPPPPEPLNNPTLHTWYTPEPRPTSGPTQLLLPMALAATDAPSTLAPRSSLMVTRISRGWLLPSGFLAVIWATTRLRAGVAVGAGVLVLVLVAVGMAPGVLVL